MNSYKPSAALLFAIGIALALGVGCEKEPTPATPPPKPSVPAPQAGGAADTMKQMGQAVSDEAQKLLDQATQYIKENKWELADASIKKVEGLKASLPAEWAVKVEQARKAFDSAKSVAATAVPGMAPTPAPASAAPR